MLQYAKYSEILYTTQESQTFTIYCNNNKAVTLKAFSMKN